VNQQTQPTTLYRHFDAAGRLLYVGVALGPVARLQQHASQSSWVRDIARMTIERFPTRTAAEQAERDAIRVEQPVHNVAHARKARPYVAGSDKLGDRVRGLRKSHGMTQAELARAAGITQPAVSDIERGDTSVVMADTLARLSQALQCDADWLLHGDSKTDRPSEELRNTLWLNVQALMVAKYSAENLTRLAFDAGVGLGTATRIKQASTSVGLDVIAKIATVFGVAPWQLLAPGLGIDK
jgi:transcriptional regulator with XRE-family HTH domain